MAISLRNKNTIEDPLQKKIFEITDIPFPTPEEYTFKFIDLFAGIGGFRIAMQNLGGKCVFTSEWDKEQILEKFHLEI